MKKEIKCATCIYTSGSTGAPWNECLLFQTSAEVWDKCLAGEEDVIIPQGWIKPMAYSYTFWKNDNVIILPNDLFEI